MQDFGCGVLYVRYEGVWLCRRGNCCVRASRKVPLQKGRFGVIMTQVHRDTMHISRTDVFLRVIGCFSLNKLSLDDVSLVAAVTCVYTSELIGIPSGGSQQIRMEPCFGVRGGRNQGRQRQGLGR